jgi:hypothetical protein
MFNACESFLLNGKGNAEETYVQMIYCQAHERFCVILEGVA